MTHNNIITKFNNFNQLQNLVKGKTAMIKLSNGNYWFITKSDLKRLCNFNSFKGGEVLKNDSINSVNFAWVELY